MKTTLPPLPRYSRTEETASSTIHGFGAGLSVVGLILLMVLAIRRGTTAHVVSCAIYGTSLILLYTSSTVYHAARTPRAKRILRLLDHCAIFLLIAGTYTPLALIELGGRRGWGLCATVWSLALLGVLLQALGRGRFKVAEGVLYLAMGWIVVVAGQSLLEALPTSALVLVIAGGVVYTAGMCVYGLRRLPFNHALWHALVLTASVLHYCAVLGSLRGAIAG